MFWLESAEDWVLVGVPGKGLLGIGHEAGSAACLQVNSQLQHWLNKVTSEIVESLGMCSCDAPHRCECWIMGAAQIELVPGSRERAVTDGNRLEYIHRVANFRLNVQIKRATDAFRRGLEDVIAREWITMFNEAELQVAPGQKLIAFISTPGDSTLSEERSWTRAAAAGVHVLKEK